MSNISSGIRFIEFPIAKEYGKQIFRIYAVIENDRSEVLENFNGLDTDEKDQIKVLISKMASVKNFRSRMIKYNLHGYNYGEIRPIPHRFFFFQKCGNNFIFFSYTLKKKQSLKDSFYKQLEKKKEIYAKEFENHFNRS